MLRLRSLLAVAGIGAMLCLSHAAAAEERTPGLTDTSALGTHQRHLRLDLGVRTQFVSSSGLDPFSDNDVLPQVAVGASYALYAQDQLSLAAVLGFDYGAWSSHARSNETELDLRRFTLGPEARYHLLRVLTLSAKLAPTLTREAAEVKTGITPRLEKVAWKFGFDATAGAAFEVFGYASGESHKPRLWLTAEGGYGWTAAMPLRFQPDEDTGSPPQRLTPLDWGELSVAGPLFRVGAALSFW